MGKIWLYICFAIMLFIQLPLAYKCWKAIREYDFSRQIAISVLMLIVAILIAGIYKLGLFVLGLT